MNRFVATTGLFVTVVLSALNAQTGGTEMRANVPFNFRIGETSLPAGEYSVSQSGGLLVVHQQGDTHKAAVQLTIPTFRSNAPENPTLEFHRYGETYFLASVWTAGSKEGQAITGRKVEREFARRLGTIQTEVALKAK